MQVGVVNLEWVALIIIYHHFFQYILTINVVLDLNGYRLNLILQYIVLIYRDLYRSAAYRRGQGLHRV